MFVSSPNPHESCRHSSQRKIPCRNICNQTRCMQQHARNVETLTCGWRNDRQSPVCVSMVHRKRRSIEKQTTTSMASSQSLSNNKHDFREKQQPRRRHNNNKSLPYDDLLEYEIGQQHWLPQGPTQTTIDRATTRRRRKNERRTSTAPQWSPNTKKRTVTTWTGRAFASCGVTTSSTASWSRSRWSLERTNLDSIGPPIRCLSWSFQKAWNDTWFLTRMDKLALFLSRLSIERVERSEEQRNEEETRWRQQQQKEKSYTLFRFTSSPIQRNTIEHSSPSEHVCSSPSTWLSLSSSSSSAWVTVCVSSCVFSACVDYLFPFPSVSNWLSLSPQLWLISLVGVRFVSFRSLVL